MEISKQDLEERFQTLADHVLLERLQAGTMTALATEVAIAELRSRGIDAPTDNPDVPDEHEEHEEHEEYEAPAGSEMDADLVNIAQFSNVLEANVLRACLESHGIFAFVRGEHLATAYIFLSNASGGMHVQVRRDQAEQAKEVIKAFERGDFAIDDNPE